MALSYSVEVFVVFCVCWSLTDAQLNRDRTCEEKDASRRWHCKVIRDCPDAVALLKSGKSPEICGFNGTDAMTCCDEPLGGKKSKEMCKKYAESVFLRVQDDLSGELTNYDTCALYRESRSRTKRVVDGEESTSREYPHMALVGYKKNEENTTKWLCAGSLISDRYILTTASCATADTKVVRLGDLNINSDADEEMNVAQPSEFDIAAKIVHPEFQRSSLYNDIALIKLNYSVYFTEFIRPICLQTEHNVSGYAFVTGWGRTLFGGMSSDTLLTAKLTLISHEACSEAFKSLGTSNSNLKDGISESSMICAQGANGKADSCHGDTGGPLQVRLKTPYCMYSQVGITSFGVDCGGDKPGGYTRVSHFVPWIESIVWPSS